ncbi:Crp/Fnr family transcriptional regulator [Nisaea sp.]|uniref:Crp/Fnr family transcriptional regulator n=1 Tax=Nisaea sp. TaxID=2024842 RepID=UPI0032ED07A2
MQSWIDHFPELSGLEPELRATLDRQSRVVEVPRGTVIFGPGQAPDAHLMVLEGVVRVHQVAENGREIVLYRVHSHESCVLTTACLLAYEEYSAEGIAESDVSAVAVPRTCFEEMIGRSEVFRRFVFAAYSKRLTDLFVTIEEVAFRRVDLRLAQKLLERQGEDGDILLTHQQLATELGTAREVVSRQLQEFQRRGWVAVARGRVHVADAAALEAFSRSA